MRFLSWKEIKFINKLKHIARDYEGAIFMFTALNANWTLSHPPPRTFQTNFGGNGGEFTDKRHVFADHMPSIQMYLHIIFVITRTSDLSQSTQCLVSLCVSMICIIYLSWSKIEKKKTFRIKKKVGTSGHYPRAELEKEVSHFRTILAILKAPSSVLSNNDLSLHCRKMLSFLKYALIK